MLAGSGKGSARGSKMPEDIFKVLGNKSRDLVVKVINKDELSFGVIDINY